MIPNVLLEMELFDAAKETERKLRWDVDVEGTLFSLYIPKWRVPVPWPSRIFVSIVQRRAAGEDLPNLTQSNVLNDSTLRHEPLIVTVEKFK